MKEIADAIEAAKKYAVHYVEVPPHVEFDIKWGGHPPIGKQEPYQVEGGSIKGSGPGIIAFLTD